MADVSYAVLLEPDDGAVRAVVPAFPEIATFGADADEALAMARDAIGLSLAYRAEQGLDIPPGDADGARLERVVVSHPAA
jgi:predicted RNase H-like HicB family nuclease